MSRGWVSNSGYVPLIGLCLNGSRVRLLFVKFFGCSCDRATPYAIFTVVSGRAASAMFPVVHCPALNSTFAEVSSTGTEFGVTVNITCSAGYRISGGQTTATVQCNSTGQWSSNDSCLRTFVILYLCDRMCPVTVSSDVLRQLSVFLSDLAALGPDLRNILRQSDDCQTV